MSSLKRHEDKRCRSTPLNCPKGYGLCWTCETHCDRPTISVIDGPHRIRATASPYDLQGEKEYPGE